MLQLNKNLFQYKGYIVAFKNLITLLITMLLLVGCNPVVALMFVPIPDLESSKKSSSSTKSKAIKTQTSSVSGLSSVDLCERATVFGGSGKKSWAKDSTWSEHVAEAKRRDLSCGVSSKPVQKVSSTTKSSYESITNSPRRLKALNDSSGYFAALTFATTLKWEPEYLRVQGEISGYLTHCKGMSYTKIERLKNVQKEWVEFAAFDFEIDKNGVMNKALFESMYRIFTENFDRGVREGRKKYAKDVVKDYCRNFLTKFQVDVLSYAYANP